MTTPRTGAKTGPENVADALTRRMTMAEKVAFLETILASSTEYSIVAKDLHGTIVAWNEGARRIYGYRPGEVIGTSAFRLHHPDDIANGRAQAILDQVRAVGKWSGELRRVRKNGQVFTARVTFTLRRAADGKPLGFTMISHDLTESQRVLEELSESQRLLDELLESRECNRGLIESSLDALMITDVQGFISDVNRQMCSMSGYTREDLIGSPFKRYFTDAARAKEAIRQVLAKDRIVDYELVMRARDGTETMVSCNASTFRSADGKLKGVFAAARNITAQKRMEERLHRKNAELEQQNHRIQEANRHKSEFLANMSHELRTPLNAIIGFSELLHDGRAGAINAKQKGYAGDVLTSARHLLQLINDVLDLAKVEAGKMEFLPEPIDPARLVSEVRDVLRTMTARKGITLRTEIDSKLKEVVLDPAKFKQVLFNYLSNALKFTPEGGTVTIRMRPEGERDLRLEVEDTGIGIKPADLPRLFAEFQQLDASASKKFPGTGLGLALTKRIVEAQGGSVGVSSVVNRGSLFFAQIPRVGLSASSITVNGHDRTQPAKGDGKRPTVLVIEDDGRDRQWLSGTLEDAGYDVVSTATGSGALRLLAERRFNAVTLDLILPDMSGRDVLRRMRAEGRNRNVPVVVVSVLADQGSGVGFAIHDFLEKPVGERALLDAIHQALRSAGRAGKKVLLVDDDRRDLKLFQTVLQDNGYSTMARSSAAAALRAAAEKPPDVVVLDLIMPKVDGFEFLRRLRSSPSGAAIPVIVVTAKDLAKAERELLGAMVQGVVAKGDGSTSTLLAELDAAVAALPHDHGHSAGQEISRVHKH